MNIAEAKEQIINAVRIYLEKDVFGQYRVPVVQQRPIFLQGAPGLGKTAIMHQISQELGIGLVTYSMTHHTRQSAIGLPMIVTREYDGQTYSVSEYTMSEIIASVYESMKRTGRREGILFLDEINCISETLSPAMLLFLQYKTFGGHQLPEGWVVVTAGNQPRYNKSVRDFDAATRDRLKYIIVEPDYEAWKPYAIQKNVSRTILNYLELRPDQFYVTETTVEGFTVVTPRSWEDLSASIQMHEQMGIAVSIHLISQYLQNAAVARDFAIYYDLYRKYRLAYDIEAILEKHYSEATVKEASEAGIDERLTLTGLLLEAVTGDMRTCNVQKKAMKLVREQLVQKKERLEAAAGTGDASDAAVGCVSIFAEMLQVFQDRAASGSVEEAEVCRAAAQVILAIEEATGGQRADFEFCRAQYGLQLKKLSQLVQDTQRRAGNVLGFIREAFGEGSELGMAVSDLTVLPEAAEFLGQFLSLDFFEATSRLQLKNREADLLQQISLLL